MAHKRAMADTAFGLARPMILAPPLSGPGSAEGRRSFISWPEEDHHVEQAFLISTGAVALAEIGDKTQLLSLVLAARYRKPVPIMLGVLAATLANHACAGAIGAWLGALITPGIMRWALAVSFVVMGLWVLVPDKLDPNEANVSRSHLGVFGTTIVTFFLAEMGDKTQLATVALAARFHDFFGVVPANVPAILLGERFAHKLPTKAVHAVAAILFVVLGVLGFLRAGG